MIGQLQGGKGSVLLQGPLHLAQQQIVVIRESGIEAVGGGVPVDCVNIDRPGNVGAALGPEEIFDVEKRILAAKQVL